MLSYTLPNRLNDYIGESASILSPDNIVLVQNVSIWRNKYLNLWPSEEISGKWAVLTNKCYIFCSLSDDIINKGQQQQQQEQEEEFLSSLETIVLTVFLSIIIVMTVFGNLLVMVALCKDRHLRWACCLSGAVSTKWSSRAKTPYSQLWDTNFMLSLYWWIIIAVLC